MFGVEFIATRHIKRPCHSGVLEPAETLQPHHDSTITARRYPPAGVNTKIGRGGPRAHDLPHLRRSPYDHVVSPGNQPTEPSVVSCCISWPPGHSFNPRVSDHHAGAPSTR